MSFAMFFNFVSNRTASAYREYATLTYTYCWVHGPLYVGFLSNRFWLSELYIKFSELYIKCFRTIYKIPRTIYKNNHPFWGYRPMHPLTEDFLTWLLDVVGVRVYARCLFEHVAGFQ